MSPDFSFVLEDGEMFGQMRDQSVLLDDTVILLSLDQLRQRLANIDEVAYYPLLEEEWVLQSPKNLHDSLEPGPKNNSACQEMVSY